MPVHTRLILLLFFLSFAATRPIRAQFPVSASLATTYLSERLESGDITEEEAREIAEDLLLLEDSPLDIRYTDGEELKQLPWLSSYQIASLLRYRQLGVIQSLYDLKEVDGWDTYTIALSRPYISIDADAETISHAQFWSDAKHLFHRARGEIASSFSAPLTHDSRDDLYTGAPTELAVRASHTAGANYSVGILGDKDRGEAFRASYGGFDFYSAHLFLRSTSLVRTLAIGDYRVNFGYGLTLAQGARFSSLHNSNPERVATRLRRSFSSDEFNFMRGFGTTLGLGKWQLTFISSWKKTDAAVDEYGDIKSIIRTGTHRTESELRHRHAIRVDTYGAHLSYGLDHLTLGLTAIRSSWGNRLLLRAPATSLQPALSLLPSATNISIDYQYSFGQGTFIVFGETAYAVHSRALATYDGLSYHTRQGSSYSLCFRHIPKDYWSYHGSFDGRYSGAWNEQGLVLRLEQSLNEKIKANAALDLYRSFVPRYGKELPSAGYNLALLLRYTANSRLSITAHIRRRAEREEGNRNYISLAVRARPAEQLMIEVSGRYLNRHIDKDEARNAYAIATRTDWGISSHWFISMGASLFRSESGADRLYLSEQSIRYSFGNSQVYGRGTRFYLLGRWRPSTSILMEGKISCTSSSLFRENRIMLAVFAAWSF